MQVNENQRLKIIRKVLKLKQMVFAASIGLTQGGYSDIERGKNNISGKIKLFLKNEHNINLNWLETGKGEMFMVNIDEGDFDPETFADESSLLEKLKIENDRLRKENARLNAEIGLYGELVKSKDKTIEAMEAQIKMH